MTIHSFKPLPELTPAQWCCRNVRFNEPHNTEAFQIAGREYVVEPLNCYQWTEANPVTDLILVWGSQAGKTGMIMGGTAWRCMNQPERTMWVMPSKELARDFSRDRWQPMLRASSVIAPHIPGGSAAVKHFTNMHQSFGEAIVLFQGSNSEANLSSVPCGLVNMDEVDKFERSAVALAEERTKKAVRPLRVKTSTPTTDDGLIWIQANKGDMRRYNVPCPHCSRPVILGWSKQFTMLATPENMAWMMWDKESKRDYGGWDMERVNASARHACPFCTGHILDSHKTKMLRDGQWIKTASGEIGIASFHLPSMYALGPETSNGSMAQKFLSAKHSINPEDIRSFINGYLAEPYVHQDEQTHRVEIITKAEPMTGATRILAADFQLLSPHFWYTVWDWLNGNSQIVDQGCCEEWQQLHEIQKKHGVTDNHVTIDARHRPDEVYQNCILHGKLYPRAGALPLFVGWTPNRGMDKRTKWIDQQTKQATPYGLSCAPHQQPFELPLFEFNGPSIKDILYRLRHGKTQFKMEFTEVCDETFWRHMDSEKKKEKFDRHGRRSWEWELKSKRWPNHLFDTVVMQVAFAMFHKVLPIMHFENEQEKSK